MELAQNPHVLPTFGKVHNPLRLPSKTTSARPKVLLTLQFFPLLTSKCASHHNGVCFFDISTSKSGLEAGVFCTFWLGNVFRTTTACVFSTSQLPKVVRTWCVLCIFDFETCFAPTTACTFSASQLPKSEHGVHFYILTWKSASHHNGVQLFISHLARWLRTCGFSEPTFRPSGATNQSKDTVFRDSLLPFRAPGSSFF